MANNQSNDLLTFAGLQLASEAFLQDAVQSDDPTVLADLLIAGNGHASAFPPILADEFAGKWAVAAHKPNTPTGFSGTLFRTRVPDDSGKYQYTISFRSTEFVDDSIRDSEGTNDLEIRQIGWALGQIADMDKWYHELLDAGAKDLKKGLPPDAHYNVTGYSLGGHLASAFMLLRREDETDAHVDHAYTFNGAGTGGLHKGTSLDKVLAYFDQRRELLLADTLLSIDDYEKTSARLRAIREELERISSFKNAFPNGIPPVGEFASLAYQIAAVQTSHYTVPSLDLSHPQDDTHTLPLKPLFAPTKPFEQLVEIYGADGGQSDTSISEGRYFFVSFSGQHYSKPSNYFGVYIEDQPRTRGDYSLLINRGKIVDNPDKNTYADTHSLVLLVDSLALMSAFSAVDPNLSQQQIEAIFKASSKSKQKTVPGTDGQAEGDTLEHALDSLRRVFQGPSIEPLPAKLAGNTWADIGDRDRFHSAIRTLVTSTEFKQAAGQVSVKLLPTDAMRSQP